MEPRKPRKARKEDWNPDAPAFPISRQPALAATGPAFFSSFVCFVVTLFDPVTQGSRIASWVAPSRSMIATIVPPCMTAIRSLMPRISGSSEEIIRMARPSPASSLISRWISALAPTSTPCVGSSRIKSLGPAASQRQGHLLLVAAREVATGVSSVGVLIPSRRTNSAAVARSRRSSSRPSRAGSPERRQGGVGRRRHLEDHAVPTAVLGHVGDPQGDGPRRRVDRDRPAAEPDLAGIGRRQAEEDPRQLGPAGAHQSRQADDLAGTDAEIDVSDARGRAPARSPPAPRRPAPRRPWGRRPTARARPSSGSARPGDLGHPPRPDGPRRAGPSPGRRSAASPPAGARCR